MALKKFACDKASPSALLDIERGTFAFIAGKMAEGGRLGIDTPFASIRGRAQSSGIGMLSIASLFFVAMEEARSAPSEVSFLDDGVINFKDSQDYKDAKFGVIQLFVKGDQPHIISLDDPSETIVLRRIGSSVSESRITNSIDQMLRYQDDQRDVMHVVSLQGPTNNGPSGSSTPPSVEFQTFVQPINFTQPDPAGPQNFLNLNSGPSNSPAPLTLDVILPPPPPPPPAGAGQINELFNTTGQPIIDSTTTALPKTILSLSEPVFAWSGGSLTATQQTTLANASTPPAPGSDQFTYSIIDSAVDFLAVGETLTVTYQVTFSDGSMQPVAVTVFGTNDAPNLAVDVSGLHQITELTDTTGALSLHQTSGTLAFADADLQDTHTVSKNLVSAVWSGGATLPAGLTTVLEGALSTVLNDSTGSGAGSIDFAFSANDNNFDFLAAGETLTVTYNITITDINHVSSVQQVIVNITGTEDVPVITSGAQSGSVKEIADNAAGENTTIHHQSGTVTFADVDLSDIETGSVTNRQVTSVTLANGYTLTAAQQNALLNAFTIDAATHSQTDGTGTVGWHYDISDGALDFLGDDDQLTLTFTVQVDDGHGGLASQNVTITVNGGISGTEDVPEITSGLQSGSVKEVADNAAGENTTIHHQSGTVTFADVDLSDIETGSVTARQVTTATLANGYALTVAQQNALLNAFTIDAATHSQADGTGTVGWHYDISDGALDFLGTNDQLTLTFTVQVDDGHGGLASQNVVITVHGTEDLPEITSDAQSGLVTEIADHASGENTTVHHQSGTVTFTDVDLSDSEAGSVTARQVTTATLANGYALTVAQQNALLSAFSIDTATHSSVDGNGTVGWHYDISDGALDFLGTNDQLTLTFTVQVDDGHGGLASQNVVITVHGTEDVPVVTTTNNSFAELPGTNNPNTDSVSGTISFNDVDLSDRPTVTTAFSGYTYFAADGITALALTGPQQTAILKALVLGPTPATSNGSVTWNYSVADNALDFLAQNETLTLTYNATVNDHHGGIVIQPITVTIHGTNDAPVIKYTGSYGLDQFNTQDYGAWIEQGNNSNGAVNGNPLTGEFQVAHDPTTAAGNFQIRLTDLDAESDVPDTLTRTYNLVGAGSTAKIEFDYRRDMPSGQSNDRFIVLASINGGAFTQIGQIGATGNGSFVDGSYQHFTFDLSSGSTIQTVALRFSVGDDVDNGDVVYVDNVKLSYATTASATQTINYTENSAVGLLPPQITDADHNATVHSATITITNHQENDLLSLGGTPPGGITASSYNSATGVLTLTGTASLAQYQDALSHILFSNTSDSPSTVDRALTITVNDGLADSNVATTTIHVTAIDDLPFATDDNVITNFGTNNAFQIPNSALLANDTDRDNTLSITNELGNSGGAASLGGDSVTFNDTGGSGGSFNYTATGGALTTSAHVTITQDTSGALDGTSGNDILIAKPGAVTMNGNGGNDFLISNAGAQIMNGGAGDDTFVFRAITDSTPGAGNFDTLGDFVHNSDHLDLTAIAGATSVQGLVGSASTVDAHSISWFIDNAHNETILYVNTTATADHVDMEIRLTGTNINLAGSDILHHT